MNEIEDVSFLPGMYVTVCTAAAVVQQNALQRGAGLTQCKHCNVSTGAGLTQCKLCNVHKRQQEQ